MVVLTEIYVIKWLRITQRDDVTQTCVSVTLKITSNRDWQLFWSVDYPVKENYKHQEIYGCNLLRGLEL